jgi:hypothetical protein
MGHTVDVNELVYTKVTVNQRREAVTKPEKAGTAAG